MKKIIISLAIVLSFCVMGNVKADMGSPTMNKVNVYVSNPDGAKVYDFRGDTTSKVISENTKLTLDYSVNVNKVTYYQVKYDGVEGYILKDDIKILNDKVNKDEGKALEKSKTYKVLDKNGVKLYKGPNSLFYDTVDGGVIPYGKEFTSKIGDGQDNYWLYVEYNGKSGWVSTWTFSNFDVSEESGVETTKLALKKDDGFKLAVGKSDFKLSICEDDLETCKSVDIKLNDVLKPTYDYRKSPSESYYYVTYDGVKGWIKHESGNLGDISEGLVSIYPGIDDGTTKEDIEFYDSYTKDNKIDTIKSGNKVKVISRRSHDFETEIDTYYIEYNGQKGWIFVKSDDVIEIEKEEAPLEKEEVIDDEDDEKEPINEDIEDGIVEDTVSPEKETNKILFMCIGGAVILAITAVVIIVLVNKKKKEKLVVAEEVAQETTKKEVVEETTEEVKENIETKKEKKKNTKKVEENKFCSNCGAKANGNFCGSCGHKID